MELPENCKTLSQPSTVIDALVGGMSQDRRKILANHGIAVNHVKSSDKHTKLEAAIVVCSIYLAALVDDDPALEIGTAVHELCEQELS